MEEKKLEHCERVEAFHQANPKATLREAMEHAKELFGEDHVQGRAFVNAWHLLRFGMAQFPEGDDMTVGPSSFPKT